jgi:hypothetical protein
MMKKKGGNKRRQKNQIKKKEKRQQNTKKRNKKRAEKNFDKKTIKEKEPKIKVLAHKLLAFTLSYLNASSLVIHQSFKSLFTNSSHVKFDRHLSLFSLPVHLITPLRTGAFTDLCWIYPNHLK